MKAIFRLLAAVFFLAIACTQTVSAAELRPLDLPSAQRGYNKQPEQANSIYKEFEQQVEKMNTNTKNQYKKKYTGEWRDARAKGDSKREEHYRRLLEILYRH